jgi:hypothetical protein
VVGVARVLSADVRRIRDVARLLRRESDGRLLRADLVSSMRSAADPLVARMQAKVLGLPSKGTGRRAGGSLRAKVASRVKVKAATGGRWAGVRVHVAKRTGMPRGFYNAPRLLNRGEWQHPLWGRAGSSMPQRVRPGWFDDVARAGRADGRAAARRALEQMADRLRGG